MSSAHFRKLHLLPLSVQLSSPPSPVCLLPPHLPSQATVPVHTLFHSICQSHFITLIPPKSVILCISTFSLYVCLSISLPFITLFPFFIILTRPIQTFPSLSISSSHSKSLSSHSVHPPSLSVSYPPTLIALTPPCNPTHALLIPLRSLLIPISPRSIQQKVSCYLGHLPQSLHNLSPKAVFLSFFLPFI